MAIKISYLLTSVKVLSAVANKKTNPSMIVASFCMSIGTEMRTYIGNKRRKVERKAVIELINFPKRLCEK